MHKKFSKIIDLVVAMEFNYVSQLQIHADAVMGTSKLSFLDFGWDFH